MAETSTGTKAATETAADMEKEAEEYRKGKALERRARDLSARHYYGRRTITTAEREITAENVLRVLNKALLAHGQNRYEIDYLYQYERGKQPILSRTKNVNAEICNRIVVNRANEIVTFKTSNFIGEPLQYVSRGSNKSVPEKIETLNSMMLSENKVSKDMRLAYWMFTCGVGYRLVLMDKAQGALSGELLDEAPFEIYTLDPRNTFIIRSSDVTKRPLAGVTYTYQDDEESRVLFNVYTPYEKFDIEGTENHADVVIRRERHILGNIPIIEYPCNTLRMGAFEVVIGLLDAINTLESNRLDGVEQFIQAIMVFEGVEITRETLLELRDLGAINLPASMDGRSSRVYYLNEQLDQTQTQTLADALYQEVLQIVGLPSQGLANTSDSSNNGAIIMKNGWWNAEARAKETVSMWKESETEFLKVVLNILRQSTGPELRISDIEQKFGRLSYEDKLTKVQAFTSLIAAGAPPIQAFSISGLVVDPESAAITYERYQEEKAAELDALAVKAASEQREQISGTSGNGGGTARTGSAAETEAASGE